MTHAQKNPSIAMQIAALPDKTMDELRALWDELFDSPAPHHNRTGLESRLAYRIQEKAFGGLSPLARARLEKIGETGQVPNAGERDGHRLLPGTVLSRMYDGVEHRVVVRGDKHFEYDGCRYKSLSAIARKITGTQWSGPAFFGLRETKRQGGWA
jgi:hypothetical protein